MNDENINSYSKQGTVTTLTELCRGKPSKELLWPTSVLFKGHK